MPPKNNPRFARIVAEAFAALGITQSEFHEQGGPSDTTLRKIVEGEPVGIANRTLKALDAGFQWTPGSAARTLAGGQPTRMSEEAHAFISHIRHPSYSQVVPAAVDGGNPELIQVLEQLLETGQLPEGAHAQLEALRDDAVIKGFPGIYEQLTRTGKLDVANYGHQVWFREKGVDHAISDSETASSGASEKAVENKEVDGLDESDYVLPPPETQDIDPATALAYLDDRLEYESEVFGGPGGQGHVEEDRPDASSDD